MQDNGGRDLTRRERFNFAAVLAVVAVAAALATCLSCAPHAAITRGRSTVEMHHSTVTLRTMCDGRMGGGSGVVVSRDRVLTAAHVVTCEDAAGVESQASEVRVNPGDGVWRKAKVVVYARNPDVAALVVEDLEKYGNIPVTLAPPPGMGEHVCTSTGQVHQYTRYAIKCGYVQPNVDHDEDAGDISVDAIIEPGNSGSGLYDRLGRLVGIVVHYRRCANGQICGGAATSIWSRRGLLGI